MPQRLKDEVRERIVLAASEVFAQHGYETARMSDVAQRAGTTASNIYKYYQNKSALFTAAVPPELADRFLALVRSRLDEFTAGGDWTAADAAGSPRAAELLDFWIKHRLAVVILIRGSEGTRHSALRETLIEDMTNRSLQYANQLPAAASSRHLHFVLHRIFTRTLDTIADILLAHEHPDDIRQAIAHFWRYQLAGLAALLGNTGSGPDQSSPG